MLSSGVAPVADGRLSVSGPRVIGKLRASARVCGCFSRGGSGLSDRGEGILMEFVIPSARRIHSSVVFTAGGRAGVPGSSLEIASTVRLRVRVFYGAENLCCSEEGGCCGGLGGGTASVVDMSFLTRYLVALLLEGPSFTQTQPSALLASSEACGRLCTRGNGLLICCGINGLKGGIRNGLHGAPS